MFNFIQTYNILSRRHYIQALDSNFRSTPPLVEYYFLKSLQSAQDIKCLGSETAHALKFTPKSIFVSVQLLLTQGGFYYVLTRSFSSDAVEATFSHICLKGDSNDTTDVSCS